MKKGVSKRVSFFLAFLMMFLMLTPVTASSTASSTPIFGRVVRIVDVNAIVVQTDTAELFVRLIGIAPYGSEDAISYLSREIMGNNVGLTRDAQISDSGRWVNMYVSYGGRFINGELVAAGHARPDISHRNAALFTLIQAGESTSRAAGLGMWASDARQPAITHIGEGLNINTATASQITNRLQGVSSGLANAIISFRHSMVFQHITDLKFVTGMTAEIFTANRSGMTVVTNINTASIEELRTLGMSEAQAENVANSRATLGSFDDIQQLRSRNLITQGLFDNIQHFISVESKERVEFARPNFRANINLASQAQLTRAGATPIQATTIISQRDHMPLRNMQDLLSGTNVSTNFSIANTLSLADNFRTRTNLNTAPRSELESLFGSALTSTDLSSAVNAIINARENAPLASLAQFTQILSAPNLTSPVPSALVNNILNFVYVNEPPQQTIVNLNTATQQQLTDAGIPLGIAQQIGRLTNRGSILVPSQIPSFITAEHRQVLTLRTNINTATLDELLSLDAGMTHTIAQRVITARANQPFGSLAEVDEFFSSLQLRPMYLRFSPIIIVR